MPDTLTYPPVLIEGMNRRYGLHVSHIGEGGALFVLGHHDERRVVAAICAEQRVIATEPLTGKLDVFRLGLFSTYATCTDDGGDWLVQWHTDALEPGAFPITVWEP